MMTPFAPITSSAFELERRRLESTIDQDLSTLSLSSIRTGGSTRSAEGEYRDLFDGLDPILEDAAADQTFLSGSSDLTLEHPRGFGQSIAHDRRDHDDWQPYASHAQGPSGTPRAAAHNLAPRSISGMSVPSCAESPVSTAGHHVSAVSLVDGVFRRKSGAWSDGDDDGSEFDPERSLGRLVGELGRVMGGQGGKIAPRPASPFSHHALSPPRSPSPLPSLGSKQQLAAHQQQQYHHQHQHQDFDLSYTLNRANPLPSPPLSGSPPSGSRSPDVNDTTITNPHGTARHGSAKSASASGFTAAARQLQEDIRTTKMPAGLPRPMQPTRRALSDSTAHNIQHQQQVATPAPKSSKSRSRVSALQNGGGRPTQSAPAGRGRGGDVSADVTGMTRLMDTPAKGGEFDKLGKNGDVGGDAGASIPATLATLQARLRGLETENSLARRRVRELEGELERAKGEVEEAKRDGGDRLREAIGQKSALEDLVKSLRSHLTRLTHDLEESKTLVSHLRTTQPAITFPPSPPRPGTASELAALRKEIERLSGEVHRLTGVVERGLETRRVARGEQAARVSDVEDEEAPAQRRSMSDPTGHPSSRQQTTVPRPPQQAYEPRLPSKLRQGLHMSASSNPTLMPPSAAPPTRIQPAPPRAPPTPPPEEEVRPFSAPQRSTPRSTSNSSGSRSSKRASRAPKEREDGPHSPFPSIRAEDEADFFAVMAEHEAAATGRTGPSAERQERHSRPNSKGRSTDREALGRLPDLPEDILKYYRGEVPPQTVLARVIRELEDDFAHYKAIYCELADQYKLLDAASAAAKRHVLADHLKEVIDTLEQKADQITSLYTLLSFHDRPSSPSATSAPQRKISKSVGDVMRMVRETLGDEGVQRLQKEGVVPLGRQRHVVV